LAIRPQNLRTKLLLALFGLVFALAVGEIAARIILKVLPDPDNSIFIKDEHCVWRFRPTPAGKLPEDHDDFINTLGFRDRNHAEAKPADVYRVLGIGDSFVYGTVSVRDNYLRLLEDELNQALTVAAAPDPALPPPLGADVDSAEVLLMGCPG